MQKETYSNDEILKIIEQYKKARERDKKQYQKHKDDPEFINKINGRSHRNMQRILNILNVGLYAFIIKQIIHWKYSRNDGLKNMNYYNQGDIFNELLYSKHYQ